MYNPDVEELFELVAIGTPVTIVYETIILVEKKDGLYVRIFSDIYKKYNFTEGISCTACAVQE